MQLPSLAFHSWWHNATIAVYFNDQIPIVLEFERFINKKNAGFEFIERIHSYFFILQEIYSFLKKNYGFVKYEKIILGYGYESVESFKQIFPAEEYIIDDSHHLAHAYGSFYQSPFQEALIISYDGGGNDGFFNIYKGIKNQNIELLKSYNINLGGYYGVIGSFLEEIKNYHLLSSAGKILALQAYGNVIEKWEQAIRDFYLSDPFLCMNFKKINSFLQQIGLALDGEEKICGQNSYDLARTSQDVFEKIFFEKVNTFLKTFNKLPIILTGGCALNIVLNSKIKEQYSDRNIFIAPNSTDCGIAVGLLCKHFKPQIPVDITYSGLEILDRSCLTEYVESRRAVKEDNNLILDLLDEKIIGVVQGPAEHGPRALGNRSIICSPFNLKIKDVLNFKIKKREWFRPYGAIVRLEDVSEYFEWNGESRWMNFAVRIKPEYEKKLIGISHIDKTCRIQTVTKTQNLFIYDLLTQFKEKTGVGVLLNTSFNVNGKPILSTYKDALKIFDETLLDSLYLDGFYFSKK